MRKDPIDSPIKTPVVTEARDFSFRIRFDLPEIVRINLAEDRWSFGPVNGSIVTLKSEPDGTIQKAGRLSCSASGFRDEDTALRTGELVRDILVVAFARAQVPADFGDRAPRSHITQYGIEMLERAHGARVLQDIHGLQTFLSEPSPSFVHWGAKGVVGRSGEMVKRCVEATILLEPCLNLAMRTAFDLYSASSAVGISDARFLLLMMAVETLLVQQPRVGAAKQHVEQLIQLTRQADLPSEEKKSLVSSLEWLLLESIGSAGRRLANTLTKGYAELPASRFFMKCYEVRSALVHGDVPRLDHGEVGTLAANLEVFVGDLISTPVLGPRTTD
jgi:hypothetical protein